MTIRVTAPLLLAILTSLLSACGMFSRREAAYDASREQSALQVPEDLDRPSHDDTLRIPDPGVGRDLRSVGQVPATGAVQRSSLRADSLLLADQPHSAWRRVGVALERMGEEVEILERDETAGRYRLAVIANRRPQGWFKRMFRREERVREEFELRLEPAAEGTMIRALGGGGIGRALLQQLQQRLG